MVLLLCRRILPDDLVTESSDFLTQICPRQLRAILVTSTFLLLFFPPPSILLLSISIREGERGAASSKQAYRKVVCERGVIFA